MTRSQAADLECASRLNALLPEVKTCMGRLWAMRFISKQERDELDAFLREVECAAGRLALRGSGDSDSVGAIGGTARPSESDAGAAE